MNKNLFFFFIRVVFKRLPPLPQLGLWTFEPAFSPRFFLPLEPAILFSDWSAVFTHLEPAIPFFFHWSAVSTHLEPTILFSYWPAVSLSNHVTSGYP